MEEEERMLEAKTRMIFHPESGRFDYSKRRATDQKGNSRVTFPKGSKDFEIEAKIQTFRTEAMALFRKHVAEKCGKFGKQVSNLTRSQEAGLKSLKKRVKKKMGKLLSAQLIKLGNCA